jgi:hypothetical protein
LTRAVSQRGVVFVALGHPDKLECSR